MTAAHPDGEILFGHDKPSTSHAYLLPGIDRILAEYAPVPGERRMLDLGCGKGAITAYIHAQGHPIIGVDFASDAIEYAHAHFPEVPVHLASAYDDIRAKYGEFDIVLSTEVIEHLYDPLAYAKTIRSALRPGGLAIISTPYHGYFKNVLIALAGKWDDHHTSNRLHGHIKFFSVRTLKALLEAANLAVLKVERVGRLPPIAASMIAVAQAL
jgi:2-polyprenyl-6-hydroxyphenyl methylase/3-demethylubiquinone-9 3-methyltransferase